MNTTTKTNSKVKVNANSMLVVIIPNAFLNARQNKEVFSCIKDRSVGSYGQRHTAFCVSPEEHREMFGQNSTNPIKQFIGAVKSYNAQLFANSVIGDRIGVIRRRLAFIPQSQKEARGIQLKMA